MNKEKYTIGVDLGGTEVKMGLFKDILIEKWEIPTNKKEQGKYILCDIAESIARKCEKHHITPAILNGVGIGVPGPVIGKNTVNKCANIGWDVVNVADDLTECLSGIFGCDAKEISVLAENDANVAALGELWLGGAHQYNSLIMVTLGTGVGGGIVVDGHILSGASGCAGEIGHMPCVADEDIDGPCNCGNKGCLEQIASASGIVNYTNKLLRETDLESSLRGVVEEKGGFTAKDVVDAAKVNDPLAGQVVEKVAAYLGKAMAAMCTLINPEIILIGGGVSAAGEYLRSKVEYYFKKHAFGEMKHTQIGMAELGNQAGICGAAYMMITKNESQKG